MAFVYYFSMALEKGGHFFRIEINNFGFF